MKLFALLIINIFSGTIIAKMLKISKFSLRQAINIPALKKLSEVALNPKLAIPSIEIKEINDLSIQLLKDKDIKCILFDKDNTIW